MKRFLYLFIAFLLMTVSMNAQHVSEEQALQKAQEFLNKKVMNQTSGKNRAPRKLRSMAKASQSDAYYIFNAESNGGFVIVSGDERTEEILGYSTEGNINLTNMPENMRAWLKGYEEQIKAIPCNYLPTKMLTISEKPIEPLIKTSWGQEDPYNLQTPEIDGQHCVTGCVATAMAQIMNYWQYPQTTTATIPAWRGLEEVSAGTSIDWENMCNKYSYIDENYTLIVNDNEVLCSAVAQLMKLCGMAVRMDYGIKESAAFPTDALSALKTYFGYQNEMYYVRQSNYSYENWQRLIYYELAQNRPVMYDGYTDPNPTKWVGDKPGTGHSFIVDGYSETDFFHINWGWGSLSDNYDGYYRLAVHDYVWNSGATIGIQPEAGGNVADIETVGSYTNDISVLSLTDVEVKGTIWEYDSRHDASSIVLTLHNSSDMSFEGLVYVDLSGYLRLVYITVPANDNTEVVLPSYYYTFESGTHTIRVAKWGTPDDWENPKYINGEFSITVERGRIPDLNIEYTIEGIDEYGFALHGEPCKVHYKISSLWEGDPELKAKLCFDSMNGPTIDLGHISLGKVIEGDVDIVDHAPYDNYNKVMVLPSVRFYTDLLDFHGNGKYLQEGEKTQVTFCQNKPVFSKEPIELSTDEFKFQGSPIYFDLPAGYYVFKQDGFSAFQLINFKDIEEDVFKEMLDKAWKYYIETDEATGWFGSRGEMTCGMSSKKMHYIFDCPSDTPYSNSITETINGKTVFFPCDQVSAMEAIGRGLYQNEVGVFHDGGELRFMLTAGYYDAPNHFFDNIRLYYYPIIANVLGDVDNDGVVDVADLQCIINIIIGTMNATSSADVNGDGEIDIADIQNVINIILGNVNGQSNVKSISIDRTETTNDDYLDYKQTCGKIDVDLSNNLTYSAFQMKVTLPEGVDIASVEFNKERLDGFTKLVKKINEQQYLVMGYSMEGYIIEGDEGNLLTINTNGNGNVIISDVVFSTPDAISYQLRVIGDVETGIKDIAVTRVQSFGNTVYINIANPQEMNVYSIGGQLVKKVSLVSGLNSFTLPKGQYIINNQKVIIDK